MTREATMSDEIRSLRREIENHIAEMEEFLAYAHEVFAVAPARGMEPTADAVIAARKAQESAAELRKILDELDRLDSDEWIVP
jgi:hypothetical protein